MNITAKKIKDGTYTVTDAGLFNFEIDGRIKKSKIKGGVNAVTSQNVIDTVPVTLLGNFGKYLQTGNSPSFFRIADLLAGVNDRNGNLYETNGATLL